MFIYSGNINNNDRGNVNRIGIAFIWNLLMKNQCRVRLIRNCVKFVFQINVCHKQILISCRLYGIELCCSDLDSSHRRNKLIVWNLFFIFLTDSSASIGTFWLCPNYIELSFDISSWNGSKNHIQFKWSYQCQM